MEDRDHHSTLQSIQWARALAALLVVHTHAGLAVGGAANLPKIIRPSNMGAIGVDIFFIISGFVISYSLGKKHYRMGEFFQNRFSRIIPAYYILTGLGLSLGLTANRKSLWNAFMFLPVFDTDRFSMPVLGVGWSLCFEIYFYTLVGFLFLSTSKMRNMVVVGFILGLTGLYLAGNMAAVRFFLSPMMLEFAAGIAVYWLWRKCLLKDHRIGAALLLGGMVLTVVFGLPASKLGFVDVPSCIGEPRLGLLRVLCWGVPSFFLVAGILCFEPFVRNMPNLFSALGGASYSLYLVHLFVIHFVTMLYEREIVGVSAGFSIVIAVSIFLAFILRELLEKRLGMACNMMVGKFFRNSEIASSNRQSDGP